ncbi:hypothetical protein CYL16_22220 [Mycobacterium sp. EPG1]|nr:hypothetical protein CYL16_22220 [Mycobacterium sp. EPG1]
MPRIAITKDVDAQAADVWALLEDFADISWIPVAGHVEIDGAGIGMRRSIHGTGETPVVETLTLLEPERMRIGYTIADNPLPVSRFDALVTVRPAPSGSPTGSEITWEVDYDPAGPTDSDAVAAREAVEAVYGLMAQWLADGAAHRDPS